VAEQFRKLSVGRRLVVVTGVLLAPVVLVGPVLLAGSMPENGQKFGIVVTSWTLAGLAAVLAWKAAK
jgi:hypothetical protein